MADFDVALPKILRHEGVVFDPDGDPIVGRTGYVNNPDDPGGETNYGITRNVALENGYVADMVDIPFFVVKKVYRTRYWDALHGDDIADQEIAEELFDTAVNMGVGTVAMFLQRTLNVLNLRGVRYADIQVDGKIGPGTISALSAALSVEPWYRLAILRALDSLQAVRYITIAENNPRLESFLPGWLRNRIT
jgi:lysozyme family protein